MSEYLDILGGQTQVIAGTSHTEEWTVPSDEIWYLSYVSSLNSTSTGHLQRWLVYTPNKKKFVYLVSTNQPTVNDVVAKDWPSEGFGPLFGGAIVYFDCLNTAGDTIHYGALIRRVRR